MFNGTAVLIDPEKGNGVATFTESCDNQNVVTANVVLNQPIVLTGTDTLAIYAKGNSTPMISVSASGPAGITINKFGGKSAIGCVQSGEEISLTRSPGGPLGTLLLVLGQGTIAPS